MSWTAGRLATNVRKPLQSITGFRAQRIIVITTDKLDQVPKSIDGIPITPAYTIHNIGFHVTLHIITVQEIHQVLLDHHGDAPLHSPNGRSKHVCHRFHNQL